MFCALSNEVPEQPVVSRKTGTVYEKRLIEKYIADHGKCPVSGDSLSAEDLIEIKAPKVVRPRPPTATSIPSMLGLFQNEWDAVMLETFSLRQQLEETRQELSQTLYQHEAACRVIARLVKERDTLKQEIVSLSTALASRPTEEPAQNGTNQMEVDQKPTAGPSYEAPETITEEIIEKVATHAQKLAKERKKRAPIEGLAPPEVIKQFKEKSANTALHSTSPAGIVTVDLHPNQRHIVTGGVDKKVVIYDQESETILHTLKGHSKKITSVIFHPTEDLVFSSSADKTARIWNRQGDSFETAHIIKHQEDVVDVTLHATGDYLVTASLDSTWSFVDIRSGRVLKNVTSDNVKQGYTCAKFHPDGLILGTGTQDSVIRVWDIKSQDNVATFEGHQGKITSMAFSENGYYLATSSEDSTVRLWDLRKLVNFKTLTFDKQEINSVRFDYSGQYLGVGGTDLRVFATKTLGDIAQWDEITHLENGSGVSDFKFSKTANFLVSVSLDRNLRIFAP